MYILLFFEIVFILFMIVPCVVLPIYDLIFGTFYCCNFLGWHNGKGAPMSFDGCSIHAKCTKCGKEVLQDSQGNWF